MKKKGVDRNWKQEIARDTVALGGLAFYILVIARALIAPYYNFVAQLLVALVLFFILSLFIKCDDHIARGLILAAFTILFYNVRIFTIFAVAIFALMVASSLYIERNSIKIIKGIILGTISVFVGYYLAPTVINLFNIIW
tara:strand:+ start:413 stop:832 length:420 start_codon:yes stop_codon:yes gene_type:complete